MNTYTHGHHESVLRSHRWRTAANSAAYLLPHLAADAELLDVGSGPGTITLDLAELVGGAIALKLLFGIGLIPGVLLTSAVTFAVLLYGRDDWRWLRSLIGVVRRSFEPSVEWRRYGPYR